MISAALLLALTAQPQAAHLLILGGGKRPADAERAKAEFKLEPSVKPADGYPRIVVSDDIPGLKPGFHILILGACAPTQWRLDAASALYKRSYRRAVKWNGKLPCPKMEPTGKLSKAKVHKVGGKKIRVRRVGASALVAELVGGHPIRGRIVVTTETLRDFGAAGCTIDAVSVERDVLVVNFGCDVPECTTPGHQAGQVRIGAVKKALEATLSEGEYTPGKCD